MTLGLQLLQHYDTLDTPQIAERLVQEAFETHKRIDAIYISSSTPSRSADMSMNTA
ncbi:MAG: hypothetical protein ACLUFI_13020 [Oscillospiraceae bacterium]